MFKTTLFSEGDLARESKEFLSEEFRTQRFGQMGLLTFHQSGESAFNKISSSEAKNIMVNPTPEARIEHAPEEMSLKFSFTTSNNLSLLFAVAPGGDAQSIKEAHQKASITTLKEFAFCLMGGNAGQKGCLGLEHRESLNLNHEREQLTSITFIIFCSSVSPHQTPELRTTAFLLEPDLRGNGSIRVPHVALAAEFGKTALRESYAGALDYFVSKAIGPFHRARGVDEIRIVGVPQNVVEMFYRDCSFAKNLSVMTDCKPLVNSELPKMWRIESERCGWGQVEASALLRQLKKEQALSERELSTGLAKRIAQTVLQTAKSTFKNLVERGTSEQPEKPAKQTKDHSHWHSH